jgi:hypothetical protein
MQEVEPYGTISDLVKITFTSIKPPKINTSLVAPRSQTFHALKSRLAEETNLNPASIRFLLKNKAVGDSKSVQEVFGQDEEAQITVMVMKSTGTPSTNSAASASNQEEDKMETDKDPFWEEIKKVVMAKYTGQSSKEEVFAALRKGYEDNFKS